MKRRQSSRLSCQNQKKPCKYNTYGTSSQNTTEVDIISEYISFLVGKQKNEQHLTVASIVWEFARYEKCSYGSCVVGKAYFHEEALNKGWRIYLPSGKIKILCGAHATPKVFA